MYLKSLTLKGFKSFAKSTTLNFHECVSAVVGPNGSGKSNISDAILWVLGERSAKNIRGDAMEDVIFSGAKNKGRAAMAEVSLCLDNSDETLKIDYSDVVITRRMYRSGESDYWLNEVPVRRLDIIDILHDSGLGSGTHSIISQGSLDSVLGYDELQLKEMIEAAAGISKHKLKKEKSLKKLERMQVNFDRISDITQEVERQLAPLKRKAKRAEQFGELKAGVDEANLLLAVDDYKKQSFEKDSLSSTLIEIYSNVKKIDEKIEESGHEIEKLTSSIRKINEESEKFNSIKNESSNKLGELKLICEKTLNIARQIDLVIEHDTSQIEDLKVKSTTESKDYEKSSLELKNLENKLSDKTSEKQRLDDEVKKAQEELDDIRNRDVDLKNEKKNLSSKIDENKGELSKIKATLEGRRARLEFLNNRKDELTSEVKKASDLLDAKQKAADALAKTFEKAKTDEKSTKELLNKCASAKTSAEQSLLQAKSKAESIDAQIEALQKLANTQDVDLKTLSLIKDIDKNDNLSILMKQINVDKSVEDVVEFLLSDYLDSIVSTNDRLDNLFDLALGFKKRDLNSSVSLLNSKNLLNGFPLEIKGAKNLSSFVKVDGSNKDVVLNLIGDVYLCDSPESCFDLSKKNHNYRFVTKDGFFVGSRGEIVVDCAHGKKNKGTLERARQIEELKETLRSANKRVKSLEKSAGDAISSLEEAQRSSLDASQFLAKVSGQIDSINSEVENMRLDLKQKQDNLEKTIEDINESSEIVESSLPNISEIENNIARDEELLSSIEDQIDSSQAEIEDKEFKKNLISKKLSELLAEINSLQQRKSYLDNMQEGRLGELKRAKIKIETLEKKLELNKVEVKNYRSCSNLLNSALIQFESSFANLYKAENGGLQHTEVMLSRVSELREVQESLYKDKDLCNNSASDVKVKIAKIDSNLEMLTQRIEQTGPITLTEALLIPELENRQKVQEDFDRLSKKIERLGNVDYSARQDYEDLLERYEFLCSNIDDIKKSITLIKQIDEMIDERFKQEFSQTFSAVNENFKEIFREFFPGGSGSLELKELGDSDEIGLVINANPAGKKIRRISLLSGGEKALVALSFLFAIFKARRTPFYVLDEVEAALDDTNLTRLLAYVDKMRNLTQFIFITHQRRTMELSDVLFGVSMQEDGITKVISQRLDVALRGEDVI